MRFVSLVVLSLTACSVAPEEESTGETSSALTTGLDLDVSKITAPASVTPGAPLSLVATVCNRGTDPTPPTKVDFYVSNDAKLDAQDSALATAYVNGLPPGGCADASVSISAPWGDGAFYPAAKVDPTNQIAETNETNNARVGAVMGIGNRPDLVVKSVTAAANALPGASITATANVCNQGTTPSNGAPLAIVLSTDTAITTSDPMLANAMAPNLAPGQCANVSATGPAPSAGTFTLGAIVDPQNFVPELVETNNALAGKVIGIGNAPDLVVTAISHPSALDSMGGSATLGVTVCNQGTLPSSSTFAELHLSTDSIINAGDPVIGAVGIGSLAVGACQTVTTTTFPPSTFLPPGAYSLGAIVDPQNLVPELQEGNDTFNAGVVGYGHGPDLVIASVTGPKSIGNAPWVAHASVCNQGTAPAYGAFVELYLSTDTSISTGDTFAGAANAPALEPGACANVDINGSMPFMPGPSAQYLGAIVDSQNRVPELVETNNTRAGALTGVGWGPDFIVSAISAAADVVGPFDATVTVCNQGTAPGTTDVTLFLSPDKTFSPNDPTDQPVGRSPAISLDAGQCSNVKVPANANPGPQGTMYLGAIADLFGGTNELIESNNVSGARVIGVGYGPDLYVRVTAAPASVTFGPPFSATFRVCNQGTATSQGSSFTAYISTDATITTDDMRLPMSNWIPSLAPGACASSTLSISAPYDPNTTQFYLGAIVDPSPGDLVPSNDASPGRAIAVTR